MLHKVTARQFIENAHNLAFLSAIDGSGEKASLKDVGGYLAIRATTLLSCLVCFIKPV